MRIWVMEIGEPLPVESEARLLRYGMWTRHWAKQGAEVLWWSSTFSHAKRASLYSQDHRETVNGVDLYLLHGPGYRKSVSLQRIRHQKQFADRFLALAHNETKPDIILSPVPTLEGAWAAVNWGRQHGVPVVVDIRDAWPQEFVDLFPWGTRTGARCLLQPQFAKLRKICQGATVITGIVDAFVDYGLSYAGRPRGEWDRAFPFGYEDTELTTPERQEADEFWKTQGVDESALKVCFFGTIGRYFDWAPVLQAASELPHIQFVLCGDGSELPRLREKAAGHANVILPGWVSRSQITRLMEVAELGLAPYRTGMRFSLPNKPIEYLAGGLGIVSTIQGELTELLSQHQCGETYRPEEPGHLTTVLRDLAADPQRRQAWRQGARQLFEHRFGASRIAGRVLSHFEDIVGPAVPNSVRRFKQESYESHP